MTEIQKKLLELFEWYHKFCVENNLTYAATAGTLLGAVRHQGFIPWDDDLDVVMPRPDYERFIELTKELKDSRFVVESLSDKKDFVYPIAKVYDITTTLIENSRYKTKRGLFIDIFPLDALGTSYEESVETMNAIRRKLNLHHTLVCAWRKGRKLYKNLAALAGHLIPINHLKLAKKINVIASSKDYEKSVYVANLFGDYGEREIIEKAKIGTPKLLKFEHLEIFAPEDSDYCLTRLYGNYMQLPPPEKRVSHHDFISLDLNKSYLD